MRRHPLAHLKPLLRFLPSSSLLVLLIAAGNSMAMSFGKKHEAPPPPPTREEALLRDRLHEHVSVLAGKIGERNTARYQELKRAAEYVTRQFREAGLPVREEPYRVGGKEVVNIEAELKGSSRPEEIVVVGAHYDSVMGSPGANDNGSGVAALLEVARRLKSTGPARTIRFVGFVNEEPPYFQTEEMGSRVYARNAKKRGDKVVAMLSLETIGYYSDQPDSQQYPPPLNLFYPSTGNFIGIVSNIGSATLMNRVLRSFRKATSFPAEGAAAPEWITGVGWSDQWAFWREGYPALMVTDTAPFRYRHYHEPTDTPDKLDYRRMARVVLGISKAVAELAE